MARKPEKIVSIAFFYQTKTPSRNCVFQHPALVKLGEEICKDYETSLADAIIDHDHCTKEARMVVFTQRMNAETDARIEAQLIAESIFIPDSLAQSKAA